MSFIGSPVSAATIHRPLASSRIMCRDLESNLVNIKEKLIQKYPHDLAFIDKNFDTWAREIRSTKNLYKLEECYLRYKFEPLSSKIFRLLTWNQDGYRNKKIKQAKSWLQGHKVDKEYDITDTVLQKNWDAAQFDLMTFLAKNYIPHLTGDDTITLPIQDNGKIVETEYEVKEISLWLGFCAYGFTVRNPETSPKTARPFLLFQGNNLASSILSLIDPLGPGFLAFKYGEGYIKRWLDKATEKGRIKAVAYGYGQGGAIGVHYAVFLRYFFSKTYTLDSPGVGYLTERAWKKLDKDETPIIINFNERKNPMGSLGQYKIGHNFEIQLKEEEVVNKDSKVHQQQDFSQDLSIMENGKAKTVYPRLQVAANCVLFPIGLTIIFVKRFIFGTSRTPYYQYLIGPLEWVVVQIIQLVRRMAFGQKTKALST